MIDQLKNIVNLTQHPKRIISLVPSQTEFLYDIGLTDEIVGITKFCIHPNEWFQTKTRVGGTKTINFDKIKALNPDLIIANKEENTQSEIEALQNHFTVYVSDIYNLTDSFQMMSDIGKMTNKEKESEKIIQSIKSNFTNLPQINKKVLYLIWRNPYMFAGQNTFVNHILNQCGFQNSIQDKTSRYAEISVQQIQTMDLDYIFLSSEPYPFKQKHIDELKSYTKAKIILVDGEMFSWYGSRLIQFKSYYLNVLLPII